MGLAWYSRDGSGYMRRRGDVVRPATLPGAEADRVQKHGDCQQRHRGQAGVGAPRHLLGQAVKMRQDHLELAANIERVSSVTA